MKNLVLFALAAVVTTKPTFSVGFHPSEDDKKKEMGNGCISQLFNCERDCEEKAKDHKEDPTIYGQASIDTLKWFEGYHKICHYTTTGSGDELKEWIECDMEAKKTFDETTTKLNEEIGKIVDPYNSELP